MQPSVRRRTFVSVAASLGLTGTGGYGTSSADAARSALEPRWSSEYGEPASSFRAVARADSGYVAVGPYDGGGRIVFLDDEGTVTDTVQKSVGSGLSGFEDVARTPNGFVAAGVIQGDALRGWLVAVDDQGSERWSITVDERPCGFSGITQTNGQIVAVGNVADDGDGWIVAVDDQGNRLWQDQYGPSGQNKFNAALADGDAVAVAGRAQDAEGDPDRPWLLWIDPANGTVVDAASLDGSGRTILRGLDRTDAGDVLAVGAASETGYFAQLSDRSVVRERTFDSVRTLEAVLDDGEDTVIGGRSAENSRGFVGTLDADTRIDATYTDDQESIVTDISALEALAAVGQRDAGDGGGIGSEATAGGIGSDATAGGVRAEDPTAWAVGLERTDNPVTASFDVTSQDPVVGDAVAFDASGSQPADGIESYEWRFTADGSFEARGSTTEFVYDEPGEYQVTLRVTTADDREDQVTETVEITEVEGVEASFTYDPEVVLVGEEITFDASGSKPSSEIESYEWDFGGNGDFEELGETTTRTFEETQEVYSVLLRVTTGDGEVDQTSREFEILEDDELNAVITASPEVEVTGQFVQFNATDSTPRARIDRYEWTWPNGETEEAAITDYFWNEPGTYEVGLRVYDEDGNTDETTIDVDIVELNAGFTFDPEEPVAEQSMTLDASSSTPQERIDAYRWDFDSEPGNFQQDDEGEAVTHSFDQSGTYLTVLEVKHERGPTAIESATIEVGEAELDAQFTVAPEDPVVGEEITFDASDSRPSDGIDEYEWTFSDIIGDDGTGEQVTKAYEEAGEYDVTLTISNGDGETAERTKTIEVTEAEIDPQFSYSPQNPQVGEEIEFDASGSEPADAIEEYEWNFKDDRFGGDTGTGDVVTYEYEEAGEFNVALEITTADDRTDQIVETVTVEDSDVVARFSVDPENPDVGEGVTVDASDSEPAEEIETYEWRHTETRSIAGDGVQATFTFDTAGKVGIGLRVETENGVEAETRTTITVGEGEDDDEDDGGLTGPGDGNESDDGGLTGPGDGNESDDGGLGQPGDGNESDDGGDGLFPDDEDENEDDGLFDGDENDTEGRDRNPNEPPEEVAMPDKLPAAAAASLLGSGLAVRAYRRVFGEDDDRAE